MEIVFLILFKKKNTHPLCLKRLFSHLASCWCWQAKVWEGNQKRKNRWIGGSLYAGGWSVLDFWISQVMGEIVSAAKLINRRAGSIYLCLRQSCWEMGALKWKSTASFTSPLLPSGHFSPTTLLLKAGVRGEADKYKVCRETPSSALCFHHYSQGHFNVFCPKLMRTQQICPSH